MGLYNCQKSMLKPFIYDTPHEYWFTLKISIVFIQKYKIWLLYFVILIWFLKCRSWKRICISRCTSDLFSCKLQNIIFHYQILQSKFKIYFCRFSRIADQLLSPTMHQYVHQKVVKLCIIFWKQVYCFSFTYILSFIMLIPKLFN